MGAWMVRAGAGGCIIEDVRKHNVVVIGWDGLPDLSEVRDRQHIEQLMRETYPEDKPGRRRNGVAQVNAFLLEIAVGDLVVTGNPSVREYYVGRIAGEYRFRPELIPGYAHTREVKWIGTVQRDALSVRAKNTMGAIQTVYYVWEPVEEELLALASGTVRPRGEEPDDEDDEVEDLREDTVSRSHEFIKDRVQKLEWSDMEALVAGILRAMGYKTRVSPPGADRGRDVIASPDGLGLESPRIRVEVKHRNQTMGAPEIRSFIGGLRAGDRGIYVSTGGFTREGKYEADRATIPVTLLDLDELVALLTQNYDACDTETRALVPLVRMYWPAS